MNMHPESLHIIELRLCANNSKPDFYFLMARQFSDLPDYPLSHKGRIVFFSSPKKAKQAVKRADKKPSQITIPSNIVYFIDVPQTISLIKDQTIDDSAVILNLLNTLFDLVNATPYKMPVDFQKLLFDFANHLTFEKEFETFLVQEKVTRIEIINSILWCLGAVLTNIEII